MGTISVTQFISLDGVIGAPETWHFGYISEDMAEDIKNNVLSSDAGLYGRKTYEEAAEAWPTMTNNEFGFADKLNSQPKYVVSRTLDKADWNNTTVIRRVEEVAKLKQEFDGRIAIIGSSVLLQDMMKADLVDEYRLYVHPIVVGTGVHLFQDGSAMNKLKLVDYKTFSSGVIVLTYRPDRAQ